MTVTGLVVLPQTEEVNGIRNMWCKFENFLAPTEWENLNMHVVARSAEFTPSTTTTGDTGHRRSRLLYEIPAPYAHMFVTRLRTLWPVVAISMGFPVFQISRIVAQVTAHLKGDYYRAHNDNGAPEIRRRTVSFAFYLHREPRGFSGGELVLYGGDSGADKIIPPLGNSIAFFPSSILHEVRPVVNGEEIASSRLAINGWIYR